MQLRGHGIAGLTFLQKLCTGSVQLSGVKSHLPLLTTGTLDKLPHVSQGLSFLNCRTWKIIILAKGCIPEDRVHSKTHLFQNQFSHKTDKGRGVFLSVILRFIMRNLHLVLVLAQSF